MDCRITAARQRTPQVAESKATASAAGNDRYFSNPVVHCVAFTVRTHPGGNGGKVLALTDASSRERAHNGWSFGI